MIGGGGVPTYMREGSALHPGYSQLLAVPKGDGWPVPTLGGTDGDQCRERVPWKLGRSEGEHLQRGES